jgi:hypothetical protein
MITDPREALADQNQVVTGLVGLAALGQAVRALAEGAGPPAPVDEADDFVHLLVAIARMGQAVEQLVPAAPPQDPADGGQAPSVTPRELLR